MGGKNMSENTCGNVRCCPEDIQQALSIHDGRVLITTFTEANEQEINKKFIEIINTSDYSFSNIKKTQNDKIMLL